MMEEEFSSKRKLYVFKKDECFIDLNLYQYGWEECMPLQSFGPYVRNHYLFHYIIRGKGVLLANDREYLVQAGQGFLICPGQVTSYMADEVDPWEYTWLEFDGLHVKESLDFAGLSPITPVWKAVNREASDLLQEQMLEIVKLAEDASPSVHSYYAKERQYGMIGHAFLFLDQLIQSSVRKTGYGEKRMRDFYIKEAVAFIEQNYKRDISLDEIAAACRLSRSYFSRIFKRNMGKSPQQFLMHYRMAKAAQLLIESKMAVCDVGAAVGYPNQFHFSRAFKTVYGMSPREYRQKHFIENIGS